MNRLLAAFLIVTASAALAIAQTSTPTADVIGLWTVTTTSPSGETTNNVEITKDGEKIRAVAKGQNGGEQPYEKAEVKGNEITLVVTFNYGASPMTITYTGHVEGRKIEGGCDFNGVAQGTWTAVRR